MLCNVEAVYKSSKPLSADAVMLKVNLRKEEVGTRAALDLGFPAVWT